MWCDEHKGAMDAVGDGQELAQTVARFMLVVGDDAAELSMALKPAASACDRQ